jgi:hypothetical protein
MYQEKETKHDGFAKKLYYDFRKRKYKLPYWERLDFKDRDEWRGIAQLIRRERKYFKKLRKIMKITTGDNYEKRNTTGNS